MNSVNLTCQGAWRTGLDVYRFQGFRLRRLAVWDSGVSLSRTSGWRLHIAHEEKRASTPCQGSKQLRLHRCLIATGHLNASGLARAN